VVLGIREYLSLSITKDLRSQSHDAVHAVKELGPFIRANATKRAPTSRELWLRNLKLKLRLNWNLMTTEELGP